MMKEKIGIFFGGAATGRTFEVAQRIQHAFGKENAKLYNVREATSADLLQHDFLILGTAAWGIGEMHGDWEMFIDTLVETDLSGKKIALFGLGNQIEYPESFVDGMGTIYGRIPYKKNVVGFCSTKGYNFYYSTAEIEGQFVGLAIDEDSQQELTEERISKWVELLKKEFK
jgi:flavodoxin I